MADFINFHFHYIKVRSLSRPGCFLIPSVEEDSTRRKTRKMWWQEGRFSKVHTPRHEGVGEGGGAICPTPEPVFLNVYGAQESIPRNEFRQPM
jgi:hypothetical protein